MMTRNKRRQLRGWLVTTMAAALVGLTATAALAYWTTSGNGTGHAATSTLNAPTGVAGNASTKVVSWSESSTGAIVPTGFLAERSSTTGPRSWITACTAGAGGTSCTDIAAVPATDTFVFRVTAKYNSAWTAISGESAAVTYTVTTKSFLVSTALPADPAAGQNYTIKLTAKTTTGGTTITDTSYTGAKTLDWTGGQTVAGNTDSLPTSVTFTSGVSANITVGFYAAGPRSLTVSDHTNPQYTVNVTPTVIHANVQLSVTGCPTSSVGQNTSVTSCAVSRPSTDAYTNPTLEAVSVTVTITHTSLGSPQTLSLNSGSTSVAFSFTTDGPSQSKIDTTTPTGFTAASQVTVNH